MQLEIHFISCGYPVVSAPLAFPLNCFSTFVKNQDCFQALYYVCLCFNYYGFTLSFRRRQWHPTPVLLPGKSHGRRSLVGYSPWGLKELDTTEQLSTAQHHCFRVEKIPFLLTYILQIAYMIIFADTGDFQISFTQTLFYILNPNS